MDMRYGQAVTCSALPDEPSIPSRMKRSLIIKLNTGACVALLLGCQQDASEELVPPNAPPGLGPDTMLFTGWDTIHPGCYIPAWPGSYWTYVDLNGTETTVVAGDWHLLSNYHPYSAPDDTSHCCWIPTYDGRLLKGYLQSYGNGMPGPNQSLWKELLPDPVVDGAHWWSHTDAPEVHYYGDILTVDSTVTVNGIVYDNVVVASIHYELFPPNSGYRTLYFYACDVGLIRRMYIQDAVIAWQEDLIDHYIAH